MRGVRRQAHREAAGRPTPVAFCGRVALRRHAAARLELRSSRCALGSAHRIPSFPKPWSGIALSGYQFGELATRWKRCVDDLPLGDPERCWSGDLAVGSDIRAARRGSLGGGAGVPHCVGAGTLCLGQSGTDPDYENSVRRLIGIFCQLRCTARDAYRPTRDQRVNRPWES
jgi:hypothetical protein